jgi:hypothetical protein
MKTKLRWIDLRRISRDFEDTSSLAIGGRTQKPGTLVVTGNLEHNVAITPRTEADRLALIAFLESDDCKAAVAAR